MARPVSQLRKRLFKAMVLVTIGAIVTSAVINIVIDPYGTYRLVNISGINKVKLYPDHDLITIKTHALRHVRPEALILGNSRAEVGIDPLHPSWEKAGYLSVYNAAIAGAGTDTAWSFLDKAAHQHPPKFILLGLDFFDFLIAANQKTAPTRAENTLWLDELRWSLRATLTLQALLDSATTIRRQYQENPQQLTIHGHNPLLEYRDVVKADGYWTIFRQRAEENAKNHGRKPPNLFLQGTRSSPDFDDIRRIVHWTVRNEAELRLVIYPYHAQLLVMIDELGLWPLFDEWKRQILRIVEEETTQTEARRQIALIDFSGFSSYAQEAIPPKGDMSSSTQWYWEAGHFKKELGDIMLWQIISHPLPNNPAAFGTNLYLQNLEFHINSLHAAKNQFRTDNAAMVAEIANLVRSAEATRTIHVQRR